jgi:hypothetical protein
MVAQPAAVFDSTAADATWPQRALAERIGEHT